MGYYLGGICLGNGICRSDGNDGGDGWGRRCGHFFCRCGDDHRGDGDARGGGSVGFRKHNGYGGIVPAGFGHDPGDENESGVFSAVMGSDDGHVPDGGPRRRRGGGDGGWRSCQ